MLLSKDHLELRLLELDPITLSNRASSKIRLSAFNQAGLVLGSLQTLKDLKKTVKKDQTFSWFLELAC